MPISDWLTHNLETFSNSTLYIHHKTWHNLSLGLDKLWVSFVLTAVYVGPKLPSI